MFKPLISVASMVALLGMGGMARAQDLVLPSIPEATDAIVDMLADTGMPRPSKVKLEPASLRWTPPIRARSPARSR